MESIESVAKLIKQKSAFLITTHIRPDGDGICSEIAFGLILERLGKKFKIINPAPLPEELSFLPHNFWINKYTGQTGKWDIAVVLDLSDWGRLGEVASLVRRQPLILNIDHHPDSAGIGNYNIINPQASATGEILYKLLPFLGVELDKQLSFYLYISIFTDTGSFRYSNTTYNTHEMASQLLRKGVNPEEIDYYLSANISLKELKIIGIALSSLQVNENGLIAWVVLSKEMLDRILIYPDSIDSEKIMNIMRQLRNAKVFILFIEKGPQEIRVGFRSRGGIDISQVAHLFGGGGHRQAAGCTVKLPLKEAVPLITESIEKILF